MQKIALPVIFIVAVAATLFYVSQEVHSAGTLALLASVLLVGQVCATLPFILEAKKPRAGTPPQPAADAENARKIIANQQVIHEDLRSLGDALVKRLGALADRQGEIEKKTLAAIAENAPDISDDLDDFFEKLKRALEEHFENLPDAVEEKLAPAALREKIDAVEKLLLELRAAAEKFEAAQAENSEEEDDDENFDDAENEEEIPEDADEESGETDGVPAPEEADSDADEAVEDDFPEDFDEEEDAAAEENPDDADGDEPADQDELELGDFSEARGATLVLDAMLGIENKPFLRGNAPGLSEDAGTPMDFVEIGRWSYDFGALTEPASVRILRNDDEADPLGDPVEIAPGQKLELAYVPERS